MTTKQVLEELKDVAGQLGLQVREVKGNFDGGRCTVDGEKYVMLNSRHLPEVRVGVLADALQEEPLEEIYLKPAVRRILRDRATQLAETPT